MKRRWKVIIGVLVVLAVLLALNTIALDNETKGADVTIDGGELVELPGGTVQVYEDPVERPRRGLPPIVLLHCYSCSLHWWDRMAPELAERGHRVLRVDLLGHGGSEKPASGYGIDAQAALVAGVLNERGIEGAAVAGHSMGASVATALAESASELVDRVVIIDEAPDTNYGGLNLLAQLQYVPVVGEALRRLTDLPGGESLVRSGYGQAFAPGFDQADGFPDPDQTAEDFEAMTYTSFDSAYGANNDFLSERPLTERLTAAAVPVMAIIGSEDQLYDDPAEVLAAYEEVPGAVTETIDGAGHSPNVEQPEDTAELVADFAAKGSAPAGRARDRRNKR